MKYVVVKQPGGSDVKGREDRVEINGTVYKVGDQIDETEFNQEPSRPAKFDRQGRLVEHAQLSELESLLKTKHVAPVE